MDIFFVPVKIANYFLISTQSRSFNIQRYSNEERTVNFFDDQGWIDKYLAIYTYLVYCSYKHNTAFTYFKHQLVQICDLISF